MNLNRNRAVGYHARVSRPRTAVPLCLVCSLVALACGSVLAVAPRAAQTERTIWDGVYTAAQAERGRAQYERTCRACHGADLSGAYASPLVGNTFFRNWSGLTLDHLFQQIQTMPPSEPRLDDPVYLDLLTFILSANGTPAGDAELTPDRLDGIMTQGEGGLAEIENFSLVRVVGCLSRDAEGEWIVTGAGSTVRTRDPGPSSGEERLAAEATEPGDAAYELTQVFPNPDAMEGHRVETKGFLMKAEEGSGKPNGISVTTVASLAAACPG